MDTPESTQPPTEPTDELFADLGCPEGWSTIHIPPDMLLVTVPSNQAAVIYAAGDGTLYVFKDDLDPATLDQQVPAFLRTRISAAVALARLTNVATMLSGVWHRHAHAAGQDC